jgi:hypothetical protein
MFYTINIITNPLHIIFFSNANGLEFCTILAPTVRLISRPNSTEQMSSIFKIKGLNLDLELQQATVECAGISLPTYIGHRFKEKMIVSRLKSPLEQNKSLRP